MKKAFIGFDGGGTKISAGLVSRQGRIFNLLTHPTQVAKGKKQVIKNTLEILSELLNKDIECLGICLAWPGPHDKAPNIPLNALEIKNIISEKYSYPVFLVNDANAFTLAEALVGQAKSHKTVVGITLGTGIGCGLVDNKQIFTGRGQASEFGHVSLNFNGPKCACGNRGCFEEYAASRAIKSLIKKYNLEAKDGEQLYKLAQVGDKKAKKAWQEFGGHLGLGLVSVIHAYDPDIIVLGGQISKAYKFFSKSMNEEIKTKSLFKTPLIKVSKLKNAAIVAAAFVAK